MLLKCSNSCLKEFIRKALIFIFPAKHKNSDSGGLTKEDWSFLLYSIIKYKYSILQSNERHDN